MYDFLQGGLLVIALSTITGYYQYMPRSKTTKKTKYKNKQGKQNQEFIKFLHTFVKKYRKDLEALAKQ